MRTSRFQSLSPLPRTSSLRRLKTAFSSPSSTVSSASSSSPHASDSSQSLSRAGSPSSDFSSPASTMSASSSFSIARLRQLLQMRRNPSLLDLEMEEEKRTFGHELGMLEPRPQVGVAMGGIFEVLDGRI